MSIQSKRSAKLVRPIKLSQTNIFSLTIPSALQLLTNVCHGSKRKLKNGNKPQLPCLAFDAGAISCSTSLDYKLLLIQLVSNILQYNTIYYNVLQFITNNTLQTASNMWLGDKKLGTQKPQMVLKHAMYSLRCCLRIREGSRYQIGWIFGKKSKRPLSPP